MERVHALKDSFNIAAVNLSLSFPLFSSSSCDGASPAMTAAVRQLKASGIAAVVASGNAGDPRNVSQ